MKRFVEARTAGKHACFPSCLDDYVGADNPVRVVDVFVDELDLAALGFAGVVPEATGRPAYHPATLLKIYIYGYLNRIQSSRRLERETPAQHRADVADRPADAGLQDDRRLPPRQRAGDPRGLRAVRRAVPSAEPVHARRSLRSTAASSRRSTTATRTSPWPRSPSASEQVEASIARYLAALGPRRPARTSDMAEAKTIRLKEKIEGLRRADAVPQGDGPAGRGRARQTGLADRSRCPLDGDQRQGHGHRRLQRADRGRCRAPSDRRA